MPAIANPSSRPRAGWVPAAPDEGGRARVLVLPLAHAGDDSPAQPSDDHLDDPAPAGARARHRAGGPGSPLVPRTVRGGRWRPTPAAAAGAVAVLVVLAVALALRAGALDLVAGAPVPDRAALAPAVPVPSSPSSTASAEMASGGVEPAAGATGEVVVHVVGEVARPGLVRVPAGARVADAVQEAGGAGPLADLGLVNLARPVVDGEQVVLPREGEALALPAPPAPGSGAAPTAAGPVDLNAATLEQLDALDGIGPVLAQRILDWRTANGRFSGVDELGEVEGIGDKLLERLRDQVRV